MNAVIECSDQFEAVRLATTRARQQGYGVFAERQFTRRAASLVRHGVMPVIAAGRAVPDKRDRNGDPQGVA